MAADLLRERLPAHLSYGVTSDGRIFFINDQIQTTSWLHPLKGRSVQTGNRIVPGLPAGWEQAVSPEGAIYFIDHNRGITTFDHPITGRPVHYEPSSPSKSPPQSPTDKQIKSPSKLRPLKAPPAKRDDNAMVTIKGWLMRQETGGWKSWKKRWCVLSNFALFFYKDDKEEHDLGSILLPSYHIEMCLPSETSKKFAFKAEHNNMKTYMFATDSQDDRDRWVEALKLAAVLKTTASKPEEKNNNTTKLVPKSPFMTWDDEEDDEDYSPQNKEFWQGDLISAKQPSPNSPQYQQNRPNEPAYSSHQGPRNDPKNMARDPRNEDPRYRSRERQDPHDDRQRPGDPRSFNPDPRNNTVNGYDPHYGEQNRLDPRISDQNQNGSYDPLNKPRDPRDSYYSDRYQTSPPQRSDHLPNGRNLDHPRLNDPSYDHQNRNPNNYSDSAYDRQRTSRDYEPHQNSDSRYSVDDNGPDSRFYDQSRTGPVEQGRQSNAPSQHEDGPGYQQQPYGNDYEGFYSPKAESKQRELAQRPLPEIKQPPGKQSHHGHQKSDPDDGYSTLTKFQGSPRNKDLTGQGRGQYPPQEQNMYPEHNRMQYQPQEQNRGQYHPHDMRDQYKPKDMRDPYQTQDVKRDPYQTQDVMRDPYQTQDIMRDPYQTKDVMRDAYQPQDVMRDQYQSKDAMRDQYQPQELMRDQYQPPELERGHYPEQEIQRHHQQPSHLDPRSDLYDGPHTYVNLPERRPQLTLDNIPIEEDSPSRPPLPTAVRQQIVEEIAQTKTPKSSQELLDAERNLELRMQRPSYFEYPTPVAEYPETKFPGTKQQMGDNPGYRDQYSPEDPIHATHPKQLYAEQQAFSRKEDPYRSQDPYSRSEDRRQADTYRRSQDQYDSRREAESRVGQTRKEDRRNRPGVDQKKERGRKYGDSKLGPINTVKEDPDMPDDDVIETRGIPNLNKKFPLSGPRLRMSISAGDLLGKTHDELVLLLIQLRRDHSSLEKTREFYRKGLEKKRPLEQRYRRLLQESDGPFDHKTERDHKEYMNLRHECEEAEKQLEVYRPLVNLVHNMVNMGSLYGGDNFMLASQYRKHLLSPDEILPAKKMIEFSRQYQEDQIIKGMNDEIKQLTAEEVDLEEKLERLYELDRLMQEQSHLVTSDQEDKEILEKALQGILRQQDMNRDNPRELDKLIQQQRTIEKEISRKMFQLAKASKALEETTAENNKIEHEVALLRTKVHGELSRSKSAPSLSDESMRTKMKMEKDLAKVQNMMAGLNQQGKQLSAAMNTLRRSSAGAKFSSAFKPVDPDKAPLSSSTYMETDLDSQRTSDLSQVQEMLMSYQTSDPSQSSPTVTVRGINEPLQERSQTMVQESSPMLEDEQWDIGDADENTKRFFGIIPREKPKVLTVRDVKRQSEQRKERDKIRKESEDDSTDIWNGHEDDQMNSIGYQPVSMEVSSNPVSNHPIYENLPPSDHNLRKAKSWSSVVPNFMNTSQQSSSDRRSSLLYLVTPRPFVPYHASSTESPVNTYQPKKSDNESVVKATRVIIQPELSKNSQNSPTSPSLQSGMFNVKRTPKGRYMTISSSEPAKRETSVIERAHSLHSSAGDLITNRGIEAVPDIVQSARTKEEQIDMDMIDKEILYVPGKVLIPERYNPESDDDITEEEQQQRQEKAEKIKRLLAQQSVHSISQPDVSQVAGELHERVEKEKVKRAQLLDIGQELARQVKNKTRQAAAERRKTWSGSPSKEPRSSTLDNGYDSYDMPVYNGYHNMNGDRLFI